MQVYSHGVAEERTAGLNGRVAVGRFRRGLSEPGGQIILQLAGTWIEAERVQPQINVEQNQPPSTFFARAWSGKAG